MEILFYTCKKPDLVERVRTGLPELTVTLADTERELPEAIARADILVTANRPYNAAAARIIREHGKRLKLIHFTTSGIDMALEHGLPDNVPVTNSSGTHANRIAQHAFGLLLALTRSFNEAVEARKRHEWAHDALASSMISIEHATLVVIGLGSVGQEVARKAKAFDMRVIGISRSTSPLPNVDEIRPRGRLIETLAEADVVMTTTVYDETSHHLLNAEGIAALKPHAMIVNVARGQLIDEAAMIAALKARRIGGAGLDVMTIEPLPKDSPLWDLSNVVLTYHNAAAGGEGQSEPIFAIIRENVARLKSGQPLIKRVHGPERAR
ncbi:MAG TPA: D-2-hydroxyacid dehydrogenase [Alphaproteobacteria bacterium]|nr:D-2-hydroxyacid dehydrogenase [Alphaproteobacteria bacterium]